MAMIIDEILSIAKSLWDVTLDLKEKKREKIERAASFLNGISQILTDAADSLSQRKVPHSKCEELKNHAEYFYEIMKDLIVEDQLMDLAYRLLNAWEIERAYYELEQLKFDEDADQEIIALRKAAGYFRAVSAKLLLDS
jgi:hypothetical protein